MSTNHGAYSFRVNAIQVKGFEALSGFCSIEEISAQVLEKPELRMCVGETKADALCASVGQPHDVQRCHLKEAFTALMTCPEDTYREASKLLYERLQLSSCGGRQEKDHLFIKVFDEYPQDIGTLAIFFLNYVKLDPGEAIYLAANEPHAYLSGELVEAMANSDNVIRAGLTPKLRDTKVREFSVTLFVL